MPEQRNLQNAGRGFDKLSLKSIEEEWKKQHRGRPSQDIRNNLMINEYRKMLEAPPKGNTTPAQHKAQARKAIARIFQVSERAFNKSLERFEQKELLTAQSLTNGVDVKALFSAVNEIDMGLIEEGFSPGTGHKLLEGLKPHIAVIERKKAKKRRRSSN